jgi:phage/plasmid-associated DNA primase
MDEDHLRFTDSSYAFERRTHAIYFDSTIDSERAESLVRTTIRDEMQGVLNNAISGCSRVKARCALADPASVVDFRKRFLDVAIIRGNRPRGATRSPHIANPSIP